MSFWLLALQTSSQVTSDLLALVLLLNREVELLIFKQMSVLQYKVYMNSPSIKRLCTPGGLNYNTCSRLYGVVLTLQLLLSDLWSILKNRRCNLKILIG